MNIKSIKVTRTITYSPEVYLECCAESGETPTDKGFREFITEAIYEDFHLIPSEFNSLTVEEVRDEKL